MKFEIVRLAHRPVVAPRGVDLRIFERVERERDGHKMPPLLSVWVCMCVVLKWINDDVGAICFTWSTVSAARLVRINGAQRLALMMASHLSYTFYFLMMPD